LVGVFIIFFFFFFFFFFLSSFHLNAMPMVRRPKRDEEIILMSCSNICSIIFLPSFLPSFLLLSLMLFLCSWCQMQTLIPDYYWTVVWLEEEQKEERRDR
jgi:hypothetical protein